MDKKGCRDRFENGVSPLANEEFSWPSLGKILKEQKFSLDHDKDDLKEAFIRRAW